MINTLKNLVIVVKNSSIWKPFKATKTWFQENVIKRKLVIFLVIFSVWLSLFLGAVFSPQRVTYTAEQLKTKQYYANGTGEINLVSQEYSPKNGLIVLQFETRDATSPISRGIDAKRLDWTLYAQNKSSKTVMEVVPIVDNKISVIIRNVSSNFGAFAIDITNTTVPTSSIDVEISSKNQENSKSNQEDEDEGNVVQFYVTTQNSQLKKKEIPIASREEFTLQEIESEIAFQEGQIDKLKTSIEQLKASIEDDEARESSLVAEAKYLSEEELVDNQNDLTRVISNIETKQAQIETAQKNIVKVKTKLETLEKKLQAVKDGTFEFSNPIETIEMN